MRLPHVLVACIAVVLLASCGRSHVVREGGSSRPRSADSPVRVSQPKYGATVVVQRGQNVYRIATENGLTALDLALWNDIPPPYTIHPGQRLRLYPGAQGSVAARPATTP
ncbi:MAG TPA: LysM domain-containing protein, partial [Thermomonas sp.]|nr:LysM domain-containing protein [Thermomonas sp.]